MKTWPFFLALACCRARRVVNRAGLNGQLFRHDFGRPHANFKESIQRFSAKYAAVLLQSTFDPVSNLRWTLIGVHVSMNQFLGRCHCSREPPAIVIHLTTIPTHNRDLCCTVHCIMSPIKPPICILEDDRRQSCRHPWPQLKNQIPRPIIAAHSSRITRADLTLKPPLEKIVKPTNSTSFQLHPNLHLNGRKGTSTRLLWPRYFVFWILSTCISPAILISGNLHLWPLPAHGLI